MKRTTLSNHVDAFRHEAMSLLRFQLAFDRIGKFKDFNNITRTEWCDRIIALKALENDITIRVCKLDDDTKGVHSLKKAVNEIPNTHKNKNEIERKVKRFSKAVETLKKERRHTQLAHLKIGQKDDQWSPCYNFKPLLKFIVEIIDLMNEDVITYTWSDGQYETYELRSELFGSEKP